MSLEGNRIYRRKEVEKIVGLSRSAIYAKMKEGTFPRPIRLGSKAVGWKGSCLIEHIESCPQVDY